MADVGAVEDRLAARDLRSLRILVVGPGSEEIETPRDLLHCRQSFGAATRAVGVEASGIRHCELRCGERAFKIDDAVDDLGRGWWALQRAGYEAGGQVDEPCVLVREGGG